MDEIDYYTVVPGHDLTVVTKVFYTGGAQYGRRYQTAPSLYTCSCGEIDGVGTVAAQAHTDSLAR